MKDILKQCSQVRQVFEDVNGSPEAVSAVNVTLWSVPLSPKEQLANHAEIQQLSILFMEQE